MLVGGGGNAAAQTGAEIIRALGAGTIEKSTAFKVIWKEMFAGLILASLLVILVYPRVRYMSAGSTDLEAAAIAISFGIILFSAVFISVVVSLLLSFCVDPATAAPPTVAVMVDIFGIFITCQICAAVLHPDMEFASFFSASTHHHSNTIK